MDGSHSLYLLIVGIYELSEQRVIVLARKNLLTKAHFAMQQLGLCKASAASLQMEIFENLRC